MSSSSDDDVTASSLLSSVSDTDFNQVVRKGSRGLIRGLFLYVLAIVAGFVEIAEGVFDAFATAAFDITDAILGGIADLIGRGFENTLGNFIDLGPFGFVEGLVYAFIALFILQQMLEFFDTDVPGIPGFSFIPFIGEEADDD